MNETVSIEIGSVDELPRVFAKYNELIYASDDQPRALDVALRPGEYRGGGLQLEDLPLKGNVRVRVHSADPAHPAVLVGTQVVIGGDEVALEDLVLRGAHQVPPLVSLTVKHKLSITRCVFVDNLRSAKRGGPLVRLVASYGSGAKTALVSDSWFAHNAEAQPSPMIAFETSDPDYFQSIRFERSVLADNRFAAAVVPAFADELRFVDCVLARAATPAGAVLLAPSAPKTRLVIEGGVVLLDGWDGLAKAAGGPAVALQHATVYASKAAAPPATVALTDSPVRDGQQAAALRAELDKLATQPRPPVGPALRKRLGL